MGRVFEDLLDHEPPPPDEEPALTGRPESAIDPRAVVPVGDDEAVLEQSGLRAIRTTIGRIRELAAE